LGALNGGKGLIGSVFFAQGVGFAIKMKASLTADPTSH
jgi:hypothetical protein